MTLDVLYFAWLRERIGVASEQVVTDAGTAGALVEELRARGDGHAAAFEDLASVRVALDQELSELSSPLTGVREVAFFPPMTGG